jgi:hypothetical protein
VFKVTLQFVGYIGAVFEGAWYTLGARCTTLELSILGAKSLAVFLVGIKVTVRK